jgi:hypothetical protein
MGLSRTLANDQYSGNLRIGQAARDKVRHFELTGGQNVLQILTRRRV